MKLLFVLNIDLSKNGASVHLLKDVIEEASKTHIVDVVCRGAFSSNYSKKVNFFIHEKIQKKGSFFIRYIDSLKYARDSYEMVKNNDYNLIFIQSTTVLFYYVHFFKRMKCPIIYNAQDLFPFNLYYSSQLPIAPLTFPVFKYMEKKALNSVSHIITISDDMKQTLVNKLSLNESKIDVVYNWSYDDSVISNLDNLAIFNYVKEDKINVLYAGNIGKMQDVETIIECAKLEDSGRYHFHIIGNGTAKNKIQSMASGLCNVSIYEAKDSKYAEGIYLMADIIIICLKKGGIYTALPSKTATCFRTNKNIIYTIDKESKFAEILNNCSNIVVIDPENPKEMLEALSKLSDRKEDGISQLIVSKLMSKQNNPKKYINIFEMEVNK